MLAIVWIALSVSACCSSRQTATAESTELRINEYTEERNHESTEVELRDTVMETKTITITKNEAGDTTFTSVVVDRFQMRDRSQLTDNRLKIIVERDTAYIAVRDSVVESRNYGATNLRNTASPVVSGLKWIFAVIVALCVLVIIVKVYR